MLRDRYGLAGWVQASSSRRDKYFGFLDRVARDPAVVVEGEGPDQEAMILFANAVVLKDAQFVQFVRSTPGVLLEKNAGWVDLYRAAAATILEEYFDAVQDGTWP